MRSECQICADPCARCVRQRSREARRRRGAPGAMAASRGLGLNPTYPPPKVGEDCFVLGWYTFRMKTIVCKGCGITFTWPRRKKWCDECALKAIKSRTSAGWSGLSSEQKLKYSRRKEERKRARAAVDPVYAEFLKSKAKARYERRYAKKREELLAARAAGLSPMPRKRKVDGLLLECSKCKRMKPRGAFGTAGMKSSGRKKAACKECERPMKAAAQHRRLARSRGRGTFTANRVRQLLNEQRGRCAICGESFEVKGYEVDHVIPISKGGRNDDGNIQLLCEKCNVRKGAKILTFLPDAR